MTHSRGRGGGVLSGAWWCGYRGGSGFNTSFYCSSVYSSKVFSFYVSLDIPISCWSGELSIFLMMGAQKCSCREVFLSTCYIVAWGIYEPIFELLCGCKGDGDSYYQLRRCSMRERRIGGYGGTWMVTWDVFYGGDEGLIGFCDECVGEVGEGSDNYGLGFDDGCIDTDKCGVDGAVVGLVEGRNVWCMEGYIWVESSGWDGGNYDSCRDGLMYGVDVGDESGGGGRSISGESLGNLVWMFIMNMDFFGWLVVGAGASTGNVYVGWSSVEDLVGGNRVKRILAVGAIAVQQALFVLTKVPSPLEVKRFDWVMWRVGVETWIMRSCEILIPSLIEKVILIWLCKTTEIFQCNRNLWYRWVPWSHGWWPCCSDWLRNQRSLEVGGRSHRC